MIAGCNIVISGKGGSGKTTLMRNLINKIPENLSITANKKTSYLQITIRDTGSGIPEEEMRYLCEPYAQLEKGKKNFLRALKLGSASILVKRANGLFDICSEVRTGTKYEIVLPIEKE